MNNRTSLEDVFKGSLHDRVSEYRASGLYPYYLPQMTLDGDEQLVNGRRHILLSSSNYLGLAHHPDVKRAAADAIERYGTSCTSSRLLNGTRDVHLELEAAIAAFVGREDALVFSTGYLANIGAIPALIGRHDVAICDAEVHACIIDGVQLSRAEMKRFRHNDLDHLESLLQRSEGRRKLVLIDSVYSMGGDLAPVDRIAELCARYGALLFLDDAHGMGVMGPGGRGTAAHFKADSGVHVLMGVLSKSFASVGGFIAGSRRLIDHLRHAARSYVFSAAIAPANVAAALAALRVLESDPERPARLLARCAAARSRLSELGYDTGRSETHIVPVVLEDAMRALRTTAALSRRGVWASPAVPPGVPEGKSLLRTTYSASLSDEQLATVFDAFAAIRDEIELVPKVQNV